MTNQTKVTYIDHCGSDLSTVNAARVSFGNKSDWEEPFEDCDKSLLKLSDRDTKLIKYLAKHKHLSPFGHAFASFHIKAPIFVARQLVKHKFLRWNEISRRYVDDEPEFYMPDVWRGKADNVKQGSAGEVKSNANVNYQNEALLKTYKQLLDEGVACEMARMVLPQSTLTEWYWSGSLDAFAAMCRLRLPSDTQQETRVVAQQISEKMSELFPVSWGALTKGETE
jgi:thymidylate synthase (FAD)